MLVMFGYGYVGFANLNIYKGDTYDVNETPQYHVMTAASSSTALPTSTVPPRSILINEGINSAKSTPDNNIYQPYLEVCGIPNVENKLQCNMCGKWFKGINKYNCVRNFKKSDVLGV